MNHEGRPFTRSHVEILSIKSKLLHAIDSNQRNKKKKGLNYQNCFYFNNIKYFNDWIGI